MRLYMAILLSMLGTVCHSRGVFNFICEAFTNFEKAR